MALSWFGSSDCMERMMETLSKCRDMLGRSSEIRMPGTLVDMDRKLLLGLGSHVSIWAGPPSNQMRMQERALAGAASFPALAMRWAASR